MSVTKHRRDQSNQTQNRERNETQERPEQSNTENRECNETQEQKEAHRSSLTILMFGQIFLQIQMHQYKTLSDENYLTAENYANIMANTNSNYENIFCLFMT